MVAEREPEDDRGGHEPATGAGTARPGPGPGRPAPVGASPPGDQQHEEQRGEEDVEGVGVGAGREPPGDGRDREREAGHEPERPAPRQPAPPRRPASAAAPGDEQRREQVGPIGLVAERLEHDRGQPGQQRVGREAGGMGDPEHRPDGLELGGVPGAHVGQQRGHVEQRDRRRHGTAGQPEGRARPTVIGLDPRAWLADRPVRPHHPRVTPH